MLQGPYETAHGVQCVVVVRIPLDLFDALRAQVIFGAVTREAPMEHPAGEPDLVEPGGQLVAGLQHPGPEGSGHGDLEWDALVLVREGGR